MVKEDLNQKRHEIQKEELEIHNLDKKIVDKMLGSDSENVKKKFLVYQVLFCLMAIFSFLILINQFLGNISYIEQPVWLIIEAALWLIFLADYIVRLVISDDKKQFFTRNILDFLAALPLPGFRVFRIFTLFRMMFAVKRVLRAVRIVMNSNGFLYLLGAVAVWMLIGSALLYHFENGITMNSYFDALWCSIVTVCTVGYGDVAPLTAGGRVVAVLLMMTGIGSIGMVTSNITAYFVVRAKKRRVVIDKNQILDLSMVSKEKYEKIADYAKYVLQQDNKDID